MLINREQLAHVIARQAETSGTSISEAESLEIANADFFRHLLATETLQRADYIADIIAQYWETRP
jgi:hypothetical protein